MREKEKKHIEIEPKENIVLLSSNKVRMSISENSKCLNFKIEQLQERECKILCTI